MKIIMKKIYLVGLLFIGYTLSFAQETTRRDSLQGGLPFERTCFDVLRYDLDLKVDPNKKEIIGFNDITFKVVQPTKKIQLDLFDNMFIDGISSKELGKLEFMREENAVFIQFKKPLEKNKVYTLHFAYHGNPIVARNAPWDGGFVFKKDSKGLDFIGVAVQGTGASLWYPCKDSQTDEPNQGATIKVAVPNGLMNVSNGRFLGSKALENGYTRWDWEVKNPINNYDITLNIADYVHIHDEHKGLDLDYYVLRANEEKARKHFEADVKPMLDCFQLKFGKYPFWEDGYKLVETPYLGMEHQSAVAYGNQYQMGYLGKDRSKTGFGLQFDFIIVHESAHEWFGNNITASDVAYNWIHEGWTTYAESLFAECLLDKESANAYALGTWELIQNEQTVQAEKGVHKEGADIYTKGAAIVHMIRKMIDNDDQFRQALRKMNQTFYHQTITETQLENYWETVLSSKLDKAGIKTFFNQYLRSTDIPKMETKLEQGKFSYRFTNCMPNFSLPIVLSSQKEAATKYPTTEWKSIAEDNLLEDWESILENYLIEVE